MRRLIAVCFLLLLALVMMNIAGCGSSTVDQQTAAAKDSSSSKSTAPAAKPISKITLSSDQIETIKNLEDEGLIKVKAELNAVYIKPAFWDQMPYDTKNDFAAALAVYCASKKGTDLYWVEFYDFFSGKKLAKWSKSWGFKIY
jgi:hypothetical protein